MVLRHLPSTALAAALGLSAVATPIPALVSAQGRGVTIRGRVELPRLPAVTERRPSAGDLGEGPARDVADRRRAVVYFESAPKGAFEDRDSGRVAMDQRNETFVPHLLAITVGTTVDFPKDNDMPAGTYFWSIVGMRGDQAIAESGLAAFVVQKP